MRHEQKALLDQIQAEEYGPYWKENTLQFRVSTSPKARGSYIEVFTVGKWRAITSCRRNQVKDGCMTPQLRRWVLSSLARNGGLIPGVRDEDHSFIQEERDAQK